LYISQIPYSLHTCIEKITGSAAKPAGLHNKATMAPQIDKKLRSLIQSLRTQGFVLKGISNGFRIKLESGHDVDIYTLRTNPSHVRARVKTRIAAEEERNQLIDEIYSHIARSLDAVATLSDFRLTKDADGVFVYYAHLDFAGAPEGSASKEPEGAGEPAHPQQESPAAEEPIEASLADDTESSAQADGGADGIDFSGYLEEMEEGPAVTPQAAVEALEAVDAKMLRQALDTLCLPRSSNVRLVLTRLFRSAVDAEELRASMEAEADKIYGDEDLAQLKMIREMQSVAFLNPLIELLWHTVQQQAGHDSREEG